MKHVAGQLVQVRRIGGSQGRGGELGKAQLILKQPAALNFLQRVLAIDLRDLAIKAHARMG